MSGLPASSGLGRALRESREKAGLSLRRFAEKLGVSAPYMSDVEHGRRTFAKVAEAAKILGVSEEWLLGRSEVITREEVAWINANPEIVAMLRRFRWHPPGPTRACNPLGPGPRRRRQPGGRS